MDPNVESKTSILKLLGGLPPGKVLLETAIPRLFSFIPSKKLAQILLDNICVDNETKVFLDEYGGEQDKEEVAVEIIKEELSGLVSNISHRDNKKVVIVEEKQFSEELLGRLGLDKNKNPNEFLKLLYKEIGEFLSEKEK